MSEPQDPQHPPGQGAARRRRRRTGSRSRQQPPPAASASPAPEPDAAAPPRPAPPQSPASAGKRRARRSRSGTAKRDPSEHSLREIVGAGPSQLSLSAALRARDVNRPTDEDIAEAERDIVLVRRHWRPPPPRGR